MDILNNEEKEKLDKLKAEATPEKSKKCKSCKKKPEINRLQQAIDEGLMLIKTDDELKEAYELLQGRPNAQDLIKIKECYYFMLAEEFIENCGGCGQRQFNKYKAAISTYRNISV
jgi:hypothetical protein